MENINELIENLNLQELIDLRNKINNMISKKYNKNNYLKYIDLYKITGQSRIV